MQLVTYFDRRTPIGMVEEDACPTKTIFHPYTGPAIAALGRGVVVDEAFGPKDRLADVLRRNLQVVPSASFQSSDIQSPNAYKRITSIPLDLERIEGRFRLTTPSAKRDFKNAQAKGEIVLKPMLAYEYSIEDTYDLTNAILVSQINGYAGYPASTPAETHFCKSGFFRRLMGAPNNLLLPMGSLDYSDNFCNFDARMYRDVSEATLFASERPDIDGFISYLSTLDGYTQLINETYDELYSGAYDILTELGELPETVRYLYDTLRRIILLFLGLRSKESLARKKFKGKELVDEITSLWMQFRYAVSPLAYSVADVTSLLNGRARAYQTARKRIDVPFTYKSGSYTFTGIAENRLFGKVRMDAMAYTNGLGLNPVKTLWELTPLSFVADWVIPIGDMLGALIAPTHVKQTAVLGSVRVRQISISHSSGSPINATFDYYRATTEVPRIMPPSLDIFLNWKRVLDGLSLSWSLFLKQHWKS